MMIWRKLLDDRLRYITENDTNDNAKRNRGVEEQRQQSGSHRPGNETIVEKPVGR